MTTDNTSPRIQAVLTLAVQRVTAVIPSVPKAVGRLEDMHPGYPSGHTASVSVGDGPQRWQTGDPALRATEALRDAVERLSREADLIERLVKQWSADIKGDRYANPHETEGVCRSCIRVGEHQPVRAGGLCRWCYDTLKLVNTARRRLDLPALLELPDDAPRKHHNQASLGRVNQLDIDTWAKGKAKR